MVPRAVFFLLKNASCVHGFFQYYVNFEIDFFISVQAIIVNFNRDSTESVGCMKHFG